MNQELDALIAQLAVVRRQAMDRERINRKDKKKSKKNDS